jgi:hypothetical protein
MLWVSSTLSSSACLNPSLPEWITCRARPEFVATSRVKDKTSGSTPKSSRLSAV